ncbi:MAG: hydroxyacylglutathione hydrolase [Alphaproteobacteria bacterium]|nr:MAG: hydroxyacylglutathione hydrolase [Alphaproteobacteria bacterium]
MSNALEIDLIPVLRDNYVHIVREPASGAVAIVDPSVADPVVAALEARGLAPDLILCTHHHPDHVGGVPGLRRHYRAQVVAPAAERQRIGTADRWVDEGDEIAFGGTTARVIAIPGHTAGHIAFHFSREKVLFCGDTLFSLGCGRLFEGTADEMWHSLLKIRALDPATRICCAHEYTEANGRFALSLEPGNAALVERMREVAALRRAGRPTVPTRLDRECATNPFLRPESPEIRRRLGLEEADDVAVFAEIRRRKDRF